MRCQPRKKQIKCWDFFSLPGSLLFVFFLFLFFYKAKYIFNHILFHFVHPLTSISVVPQSPNHSRLCQRDTWLQSVSSLTSEKVMSSYWWIYTCSFYVPVTNELEVYLLNYCPNGWKRFFNMVQSPETFFELTLNEIKQIDNINKMLWSESQPNLRLFLRASQIYFVTVKFYCWFTDFYSI